MNILITNLKLTARSGTETYVRDLGLELLRRGHVPMVYAPVVSGGIAEELRHASIAVVDRLERVPVVPDLIHGHHTHQTVAALLRFDRTPGVFVCHDAAAWHDEPPVFPRILRYVPVDETCRDRVVRDSGIVESRVRVVLNFVNLRRFVPRGPLPPHPRRALVFSHLATSSGFAAEIRAACEGAGMAVDVAGGSSGRLVEKPEDILGGYDLIFAKGKAAQEALAVGAAVILCDRMGLGGLVTLDRFDEMRGGNFGRRQLRWPVTRDAVAAEIARYDPHEAAAVCQRLRVHGGVEARVDELLQLYGEVVAEHARTGPPDRDIERQAIAAYMERIASTEAIIDSESYKRENLELAAEQQRMAADMARLQAAVERRENSLPLPGAAHGAWRRAAERLRRAHWRRHAATPRSDRRAGGGE